jgi:glycerophosphoryl diester phosphodiesterase
MILRNIGGKNMKTISSNYKKSIAVFLFCVAFSHLLTGQISYIAHRGASFLAPENTLSSARLAWELNADAVELDIYLSKDGKIMVIHDSNTKRTSGQDYKVKETNSNILRNLDVGSFKDSKYKGEKIPFLDEMINTIPVGKKLVIELKSGSDVFPKLKKIVKKCGKQDQLIFICFDKQAIITAKQLFPKNPCYWLCGNKEDLLKNIRSIADSGVDGVDLNYQIVDEQVMNTAKDLKLDVIVYTVNDPEVAKRIIKYGVIGITSDRSDWLKKQIESIPH